MKINFDVPKSKAAPHCVNVVGCVLFVNEKDKMEIEEAMWLTQPMSRQLFESEFKQLGLKYIKTNFPKFMAKHFEAAILEFILSAKKQTWKQKKKHHKRMC